jgi:hypothetical protein
MEWLNGVPYMSCAHRHFHIRFIPMWWRLIRNIASGYDRTIGLLKLQTRTIFVQRLPYRASTELGL